MATCLCGSSPTSRNRTGPRRNGEVCHNFASRSELIRLFPAYSLCSPARSAVHVPPDPTPHRTTCFSLSLGSRDSRASAARPFARFYLLLLPRSYRTSLDVSRLGRSIPSSILLIRKHGLSSRTTGMPIARQRSTIHLRGRKNNRVWVCWCVLVATRSFRSFFAGSLRTFEPRFCLPSPIFSLTRPFRRVF